MNCRMASSVCGDVGLAATEVDEARDEPPPRADAEKVEPITDERSEAEEEEAVGSWGGWCSRMKRTPEPVRKAEM